MIKGFRQFILRGNVVDLAVAVVIGVGYWRGWFQVSTDQTSQKTNISINVDKEKIQADADTAKAKVQDAGNKVKEQVKEGSSKPKEDNR